MSIYCDCVLCVEEPEQPLYDEAGYQEEGGAEPEVS